MHLQKHIAQRNAQKNVIEHFMTKIEEVKNEESLSLTDFKGIFEKLQSKVKLMEELNDKITNLTDIDELNEEIMQTETYMLDLELKLRYLSDFKDKQIQALPQQPSYFSTGLQQSASGVGAQTPCTSIGPQQFHSSESSQLPSDSSVGSAQTSSGVQYPQLNVNAVPFIGQTVSSTYNNSSQFHRLPKLSLPTFNGDILKWQGFWDSFESTIHLNTHLTDVQKFTYLQSQLEGVAARTIDGFALTNANYLRAISLLRERFGQQHKITHAMMQALIQLPAPFNTVSSLQTFYDNMESYIRGLESMGQKQESYGSLLVPIILDKMPPEVRKNLTREHGDNNWQLEELRTALRKEVRIMEAGSQGQVPEVNDLVSTASFYTGTLQRQRRKPTRNKKETEINDKRRQSITCAFCEEYHKSVDCTNFPDMTSRMQKVKDKQLCFNCLRKHQVVKCMSQQRCRVCNKKHHTSICNNQNQEQRSNRNAPEVQSSTPETTVLHSSTRDIEQGVLLKTAVCKVTSGQIQTDAHILFDEGAQKSFITETLANQLQLPRTGTEPVRLSTFGNKEQHLQNLDTATVYLITDKKERIHIHVLIVPTIATPISTTLHSTASCLPYLRGLNLAHPVTGDQTISISLLIGADHYWDVIEDHIIRGCGPTAMKSKIGYLLSGPVNTPYSARSTSSTNYIFNVITSRARDETAIERFWSLESIGITPNTDEPKNTDYLANYQQTSIEFTDDKYTAALPWKTEHDPLPSNYNIARKRTESTIRRLSREPDMLKKYGEIIAEQERRGFIEKIDGYTPTSNTVHYIPHHPVRKESSTTPIRIVYDCSCKQSSELPSLNDCLDSIPPILDELTSILMRFRLHQYAVTTDIEKAFLHVGLHEKDRDVTRFLWLSDPSDKDSQLCTYRFKAVLFGATCSPFILNATILKHLELNQSNKAADILGRDLYVDNVLSSFQDERDILTYYRNARDLMMDANMNLRSWTSNNQALREIATSEGAIDSDEVTKVLGMRWKPEADTMTFVHRDIPKLDTVTKRDILRYSSRIYDPLGLLSPVTVRAKLLLQQLWSDKFDWDVPLPPNVQETWKQLAEDLNIATAIEFSRQYVRESDYKQKNSLSTESTLHVFVDSSVKSYGAAVYIVNTNGSRLVMAKNRVAPLKPMTLPQLELMAAVVGARLIQHAQQSLNISNVICWSDSQIVLCWLVTSKPLKRFVRNRVEEIKSLTLNYPWRYCPTHGNPADLLTRGIPADQLVHNTLWNTGPSWIKNDTEWPDWEPAGIPSQIVIDQQTTDGSLPSNADINQTSVVHSLQCDTDTSIHQIVNIEKYSKYSKLLRVTAFILRFINNCRNQTKLTHTLTTAEFEIAERIWLKSSQEITYPDVLTALKSNRPTRLPLVRQLRLFLDSNGIIRCGGRIHNAHLSDVTRFPYLLPRRHPLTHLVVLDTHEKQIHSGTNATSTQIRQKYWIPATRQCVKSILRKCTTCRRVQGKPYRAPDPPPLPKVRVEESPPFSVTGVDYTGALYVRDNSRSESKVYICLFTCASTRALHLEIVSDLSQESFILAFRRFVSRRSVPKIMMSDNGTTFIGASNVLKQIFESTTVRETLSKKGTEWHFIPKRAPWYGGWWERLIGLTKTALKKVLGRSLVTMETLQTVVTEIEAMLNDRPLTQVPSSNDDMEPLTPSHLLYGRRLTSLPYNTTTIDVDNSSRIDARSTITKRAKLQSMILDHFWKRWRTEYLTALRETHRKSGTNAQTIAIGDVVQIHDECPRSRWKMGVIEQLLTGRDDRTRAAIIRTNNGTTTRPIVKLYPLEVLRDKDA